MKKMIFVALATLFSLSAMADDYSLYILQSTTQTSYQLSTLQKITFSGGNVVIQTKSGETAQVAISNIERMYFDISSPETGLNQVAANRQLAWDGQQLSFKGMAGRIEVFQTSGTLVTQAVAADGDAINLSQLPAGVYIVKVAGKSFKIVKK